ncbi:hypothetical protein F4777DRAFT_529846, partial [Nemania sp. FL0916]
MVTMVYRTATVAMAMATAMAMAVICFGRKTCAGMWRAWRTRTRTRMKVRAMELAREGRRAHWARLRLSTALPSGLGASARFARQLLPRNSKSTSTVLSVLVSHLYLCHYLNQPNLLLPINLRLGSTSLAATADTLAWRSLLINLTSAYTLNTAHCLLEM